MLVSTNTVHRETQLIVKSRKDSHPYFMRKNSLQYLKTFFSIKNQFVKKFQIKKVYRSHGIWIGRESKVHRARPRSHQQPHLPQTQGGLTIDRFCHLQRISHTACEDFFCILERFAVEDTTRACNSDMTLCSLPVTRCWWLRRTTSSSWCCNTMLTPPNKYSLLSFNVTRL